MKKFVYCFCLCLAFYCVAAAGYAIVQKEWLPTLTKAPSAVQAETGDIATLGAQEAARRGFDSDKDAVVFFENAEQINGLSVGYWLYPMRIRIVTNPDKSSPDNSALNPFKSFEDVVLKSKIDTIIYIGPSQKLNDSSSLLIGFSRENILTDSYNNTFTILERK